MEEPCGKLVTYICLLGASAFAGMTNRLFAFRATQNYPQLVRSNQIIGTIPVMSIKSLWKKETGPCGDAGPLIGTVVIFFRI
jgi:hypothetical protein